MNINKIKDIKIQGATNVAIYSLKLINQYVKNLDKVDFKKINSFRKKIISIRPTEPLAQYFTKKYYTELRESKNIKEDNDKILKKLIEEIKKSRNKITENCSNLIKNNYTIYTHCHSSTVVDSLILAKRKGIKFKVYNTETRPKYQGRITSRELSNHNIPVTHIVDSYMSKAIENSDIILLGADAITKKGIYNKVGSRSIAILSEYFKKRLYIVSSIYKFAETVKIEYRNRNEIWKNAPRKIKIDNPAFEFVDKKYIYKIVCEKGILNFEEL